MKNTTDVVRESNIVISSLSTILTTIIMKLFKLDTLLYGPLNIICTELFYNFEFIKRVITIYEIINLKYFFLFGTIFLTIFFSYFGHKNSNFLQYFKKNKYQIIKISERTKMIPINEYFLNNKYCSDNTKYRISIPESSIGFSPNIIKSLKSDYNTKMFFHDKKYNIHGYYVWNLNKFTLENKSTEDKSAMSINTKFVEDLELAIHKKSPLSIVDYLDKIENEYSVFLNKQNEKCLYFVKYYFDSHYNNLTLPACAYYDMYNSDTDFKCDPLLFFNTFFHNKKQYLMDLINSMKTQNKTLYYEFGQIPKLGLILYGPPGTGKSNFAYRLARFMNRHIITLDLMSFTRMQVLNTLQNPAFGDHGIIKPSSVIFLFDEFDDTVFELYNRDKLRKNYYDMMIKKNNFIKQVCTNQDVLDDSTSKESEKYDSMIKSVKEVVKNNEDLVTMNQMLEIFQGSVPLDGAIFIATTNKFEEINKIFPQLFRHGRLSPIFFGNFNGKTIKEICKYYFGPDIEINIGDEFCPDISNSLLLEWVQHSYKLNNGIEIFKTKLNEFLRDKNMN